MEQADLATGSGTGFLFSDYTPEAFAGAINAALKAYANQKQWRRLVENAMSQDFSWERSAYAYLNLYKLLVEGEK